MPRTTPAQDDTDIRTCPRQRLPMPSSRLRCHVMSLEACDPTRIEQRLSGATALRGKGLSRSRTPSSYVLRTTAALRQRAQPCLGRRCPSCSSESLSWTCFHVASLFRVVRAVADAPILPPTEANARSSRRSSSMAPSHRSDVMLRPHPTPLVSCHHHVQLSSAQVVPCSPPHKACSWRCFF